MFNFLYVNQRVLIFFMIFFSFFVYGDTIKKASDEEFFSNKKGEYIIKQPIKISLSKAQKILNAFDKLYVLMPGIINSTKIVSGENYKILKQTYQADYTFGLSIPATIYIQKINPNEIQYHLLKSNRIRVINGDISIHPIDEQHILVIDKIFIDPIMPFFLKPLFFKRFKNQLMKSDIKLQQFFDC